MRSTHTFATMEVSQATYDEIKQKLLEADYHHAFVDGHLDMHGIGLAVAEAPKKISKCPSVFSSRPVSDDGISPLVTGLIAAEMLTASESTAPDDSCSNNSSDLGSSDISSNDSCGSSDGGGSSGDF